MINITKNAIEKFDEFKRKAKNPENAMLRIYFGGFG